MPRNRTLIATIFFITCTFLIGFSTSSTAGDKASRVMEKHDSDGDGLITRDEWQRGNRKFKRLDNNGDGELTMEELRARFGGGEDESSQDRRGVGKEKYVRKRVKGDFGRSDLDGDDQLGRAEWNRRGNFDKMDTDKDGYLSFDEVLAMYHPTSEKGMVQYSIPPGEISQNTEPTIADSLVDTGDIDGDTLCAIGRGWGCDVELAISRGFFETGLGPLFPSDADCFAVDDGFALDYSFKRNRRAYHGGIDIPTPYGVPMLAIANGTVISVYEGSNSKRGKEINLRHSPDDTGLPIWIYSQYAHLDKMPDIKVGQRVRMGEVLGPTGNSGLGGRGGGQSKKRRPAIHFAMWFSKSPKYAEDDDKIIPVDGYWMDPIAIYRQSMPVDSASMKTLPDEKKLVPIPVIYPNGTTSPDKTRLIWPYACLKE